MSSDDLYQPNQILGAGAKADIPADHRAALEKTDKPFESFTQRQQILILHTQIDNLRTGFGFQAESIIQQAGALQCVMGILKQLKPEWTITSAPVKGGLKWFVADAEGKPVESIFPKIAEESRPVRSEENPAQPGDSDFAKTE
jgi:hypothetical protein